MSPFTDIETAPGQKRALRKPPAYGALNIRMVALQPGRAFRPGSLRGGGSDAPRMTANPGTERAVELQSHRVVALRISGKPDGTPPSPTGWPWRQRRSYSGRPSSLTSAPSATAFRAGLSASHAHEDRSDGAHPGGSRAVDATFEAVLVPGYRATWTMTAAAAACEFARPSLSRL